MMGTLFRCCNELGMLWANALSSVLCGQAGSVRSQRGSFPLRGVCCGGPNGVWYWCAILLTERSVAFGRGRRPGMTGIQFITDEKGRKTAAVIDLKKHSALWEDIADVLVSRSRRHEKRIPLEKVKANLIASGKLRG
jgi:hypothetical protein